MERHVITCEGDDGQTTFRYYALCDPNVPADQVGWVLVIDGPKALAPQYVTPGEIVGDLRSMGIDDDAGLSLLRVGTEEMLVELATRGDKDDPESATAKRIAELTREIDRLPTTTPQEIGDDASPDRAE